MSEAWRWSLPVYGISGTKSEPRGVSHGPPVVASLVPKMNASAPLRIILGIDPGLRKTGFGVIRIDQGQAVYLGSGTISTASESKALAPRLGIIFTGVSELVQQFRPTEAAIEKVFVNVNPQSTLLLGQARGAALVALQQGGLDVSEYTALQLRQAVVGYGHAAKFQIQAMVQRLLALPREPSPDAADALACALCHWHTSGSNALMAKARRR
jgi:crossover junction endodeoxyribonuclease RuvC